MTRIPAAQPPLVTAIIPTFNRAHFLGECLEAVLHQTRPAHQVIVVDDGSTDATGRVVASFGGRVECHRQTNAGKAAALNRALRHARGSAIWIVDDDDIAAPGALALLGDALARAPDAGFAFGRYDNFTEDDGERRYTTPHTAAPCEGDFLWTLLMGCFVFQPAMLVRRACFEAVGPFDEQLARAQDFDMLVRLVRRFPGMRVDAVVFHQRQHEGVRGPASLAIPGAQIWTRQREWDARVVAKCREDTALASYLPQGLPSPELDPCLRARALARRAAAMARHALWTHAADDAAAAAGTPCRPDKAFAREITIAFGQALRNTRAARGTPPRDAFIRLTRTLGGPVGRAIRAAIVRERCKAVLAALRIWVVGRVSTPRAASIRALKACSRLGRAWRRLVRQEG